MFIRSLFIVAAMACIAGVSGTHFVDVQLTGPTALFDDHPNDGVQPTAVIVCTAENEPGTGSFGSIVASQYTITQLTGKPATINPIPPVVDSNGDSLRREYDVIFPDGADVYTFRCDVAVSTPRSADLTVDIETGLPFCDCRNSPHPDLPAGNVA